ncbi:aminotransferase class I/II-fold pyridoxal phosphate-dependent enzyme [Brevundimonas sp.]|uniref:DegT/DnrJ/EryC1/StrS family aminotransferase n=1 Tax=Brevundimonas sp. TaxID=1871086 RepID=UPI0028AC184C|nr:aminotransferase class I/II-fold pyridoxal phosphate-dependent enzyme [Brevundimonas sp.]
MTQIESPPRAAMRVPYGQTVHGEEEIAAVVAVLRGSTQMGDHVGRFQQRVADLFDKTHGVMVNSGSSANYLAVELLGLPEGSEVVTPVLTFATTVAPLVKNRLIPAFVDVEPDTFNIDVERIEAAITPRTRAMMIPSLIGNLPDWDRINAIAKAHDLLVIEDSADTLGASLRGVSTGARSDISTTSFYGSHVINCAGNGGMLCVNRDDWRDKARLLRSWGRNSSLFDDSEAIQNRFNVDVGGIPYDAKFVFSDIGYNFEPSEMGAAFGLVQLSRLDANVAARARHFAQHAAFFAAYEDWLILPRQMADAVTGWLAYPIIVRDDAPFTRRDLQIYLETRGIQTRTVFTGNILRQPGFTDIQRREAAEGYPNADRVMRGGMLLACHHGLTPIQIDYVHEQFRAFAERHR